MLCGILPHILAHDVDAMGVCRTEGENGITCGGCPLFKLLPETFTVCRVLFAFLCCHLYPFLWVDPVVGGVGGLEEKAFSVLLYIVCD